MTSSVITERCEDCDFEGDMPIEADDGYEVEARCPDCGTSTYFRIEES